MKFTFLNSTKIIKSEHPPDVLINRLKQIVDLQENKPRILDIAIGFTSDKDYYGLIRDNRFYLKETMSFNKSGRVTISGSINKDNTGSIIKMKIESLQLFKAFYIFWLLCILAFQSILIADMIEDKDFRISDFFPIGICLFGSLIFIGLHMMYSGIFDEFEELFTKPLVVRSKRRRR